MSGSFSSLPELRHDQRRARHASRSRPIRRPSAAVVFNTGVINGRSRSRPAHARFENSGWMGITAAGAGVTTHTDQRHLRPDIGRNAGAARRPPNGVSDQLVVNGQAAARRHGAGACSSPGTSFSKSYNLLTATGGLTGTFNTLSTQNLPAFLSASLGYGATNVTLNLQSSLALDRRAWAATSVAVGRALDGAFNDGSGLSAASGLFGLSAGEIGQALTVLSGSNASVVQSIGGARRRRPVRRAAWPNRAAARQAAPQSGRPPELAQARLQATACEPCRTPALERLGHRLRRRAMAQCRSRQPAAPPHSRRSAAALSAATIASGRRRVVGAGRRPQRHRTTRWRHRRQRPRHRRAFRPVRHAELGRRSTSTPPLAYSRFDGSATRLDHRHRHDRDGEVLRHLQPAGRADRGRPAVRVRPVDDRLSASRRSPPSSRRSSGRPPSSESSVTATGAPGAFALNYQAQGTTSLPTFLGAQFDAETELNAPAAERLDAAAWVHEFSTDRGVTAGFTVLPGTSFTVDGARAASDAARLDLGVQVRRRQPDLAVRQRQRRAVVPRPEHRAQPPACASCGDFPQRSGEVRTRPVGDEALSLVGLDLAPFRPARARGRADRCASARPARRRD